MSEEVEEELEACKHCDWPDCYGCYAFDNHQIDSVKNPSRSMLERLAWLLTEGI